MHNSETIFSFVVESVACSLFVFIVLCHYNNMIAIGIAYSVIIFLTQSISRGHLNPLFPIALTYIDKMGVETMGPYIIAQLFGTVFGIFIFINSS